MIYFPFGRMPIFSFWLAFLSLFVLSACGEGWEMQKVTSFPYGNSRTAGSGIAYVQTKMAPEKTLNVEPMSGHLEPGALKAVPPKSEPQPIPAIEAEPEKHTNQKNKT